MDNYMTNRLVDEWSVYSLQSTVNNQQLLLQGNRFKLWFDAENKSLLQHPFLLFGIQPFW
jgi:hypothetical protein